MGRRPPLLIGAVVCTICMFYVGAYIKVANPSSKLPSELSSSSVAGGKAAVAAIVSATKYTFLVYPNQPLTESTHDFKTVLLRHVVRSKYQRACLDHRKWMCLLRAVPCVIFLPVLILSIVSASVPRSFLLGSDPSVPVRRPASNGCSNSSSLVRRHTWSLP